MMCGYWLHATILSFLFLYKITFSPEWRKFSLDYLRYVAKNVVSVYVESSNSGANLFWPL